MTASRATRSAPDGGSAAVEFTLVAVLLVLLVGGLMQLALTLHVRNTLISCAAEGARVAAQEDRSPADGARRTEDMVRTALGDYPTTVTVEEIIVNGAPMVVVHVSARVPLVGLWGVGTMSIEARAIEEGERG